MREEDKIPCLSQFQNKLPNVPGEKKNGFFLTFFCCFSSKCVSFVSSQLKILGFITAKNP